MRIIHCGAALALSLLLVGFASAQAPPVLADHASVGGPDGASKYDSANQVIKTHAGNGDGKNKTGDQCYCPPRVPNVDLDDSNCRCDFTRCGPAVIQHQTFRVLGSSVTVYPNRPTVFAWFDCPCEDAGEVTFESDCFVNAERGVFGGRLSDGDQVGFYVTGNQMTPGKQCVVKMKSNTFTVNVRRAEELSGVLVAHNLFRNIQDKSGKQKGNVFSFITNPKYNETFQYYANRLHLTQTTLLQTAPLHSVSEKEVSGSAPGPILEALKSRQSVHVTCDVCGDDRRCEGKPYQGPHDPYNGEGNKYHDMTTLHIAGMLGDLDYENLGLNIFTRAFNLVNLVAEYEDGIHGHGYYELTAHRAGYVMSTTDQLKQANEIPHELGHSFELPDFAGQPNTVEKLLSYAVLSAKEDTGNTEPPQWGAVRVVNPYFSDPGSNNPGMGGTVAGWKSGSMNHGLVDGNNGVFTQYSGFELETMVRYWETSRTPIDSRINLTVKGETTIVVNEFQCGVYATRINIVLPTSPAILKHQCKDELNCVKVKAVFADGREESMSWESHKEPGRLQDRGTAVALPQSMNGYDYLIVEYPARNLKRYFTIGNDAKVLPDVLVSRSTDEPLSRPTDEPSSRPTDEPSSCKRRKRKE